MAVPLITRILLADDHTDVRRGLRMVLDAEPDLTVVAEAGDGIEAVELGLREEIDLAVIDVAMPKRSGLDAARELLKHRPQMRILMLSMHDVEEFCFQALKAGASGYVLKTVADKELVEACRAAMRGEPFLYPAAVRALIRDFLDRASRGEQTTDDPLTPRAQEVVKLIAEGHTSEEIAGMLFISKKTVDRHRANVLEKLGMRNRVELTRYAMRRGLVEP
jgi:DNA-binding NarL/FixJ family response regulator